MGYRVINGKLYSIEDFSQYSKVNKKNVTSNSSFEEVLTKEIKKESFVLSNHAAERLRNRNIFLNEKDMANINEGINKASDKGAKDSLILYKDLVLIASIENRTIITAIDKGSSKDNVYTNIDSVVLL